MIQAAIFDMDGVLIDSEPFWREAEKIVFAKLGINLTEEQCRSTTGLRIDLLVEHWNRVYPNHVADVNQTANDITNEVIRLVRLKGQPMAGVKQTIALFKKLGFKVAVASASPVNLIDAVVEKLGIEGQFSVLVSGQHAQYGKPHPEIYLTAATRLGVNPTDCIAIEDSLNGIISAKAARMRVIAVPDADNFNRREFGVADVKLQSLEQITQCLIDQLR